MNDAILEVKDLTKTFGGITAVNKVSFDLNQSELTGLIGPNGAGKTTLLRLVTGLLKPDSGRIIFKGEDITGLSANKRVRKGIVGTFQNVRPFNNLPVIKNVLVPALATAKKGQTTKMAEKRARDALEFVGISGNKMLEPASSLSHGDLKKLEIARAIAAEPAVLLLDEPFAGLNPSEIEQIAKLLSSLRCHGVSIIIIEHKLIELMKIVHRVIVLNFGTLIADATPMEIVKNEAVIKAYLGEEETSDARS